MPKKIKKRSKRAKFKGCVRSQPSALRLSACRDKEIVDLSDLVPKTVDIRCPYGHDAQAAFEDYTDGVTLDTPLEYACTCRRQALERECRVSVVLSVVRPGIKVVSERDESNSG